LIDPNKVNNQSNLGSGFNLFFEKPYDSTMNNNFILSFGLYKKNLIYDDYIEDNKNYKNQEENDYFTIQFIYTRKLLEYNNNRIFISGGSFIAILLKSESSLNKNYRQFDVDKYEDLDFGLSLGLAYEYSFSLAKVGIMYEFQQGFINKLDNYNMFWNQTNSICFYIALEIFK